MKHILVLILIAISLDSLAVTNKEIKSTSADSLIMNLRRQLELSELSLHKQDSLTFELANELLVYRAKESYFHSALSDQSTRFATILALIFAIFAIVVGLLSWDWRKRTLSNLKRHLEKERDKTTEGFKNMMEVLDTSTQKIYDASSNVNRIISEIKMKEGELYIALLYSLNSTADSSLKKNHKPEMIELSLEEVKKLIEDISDKKESEDIENIKNGYSILTSRLDIIEKHSVQDFKVMIAKIRVGLDEICQLELE